MKLSNSKRGRFCESTTPDVPTDEWGNPERFESGCVDWIVGNGIEILGATCEGYDEAEYTINVEANVCWSNAEEDDAPYQCFEVVVYEDEGELCVSKNFERIR